MKHTPGPWTIQDTDIFGPDGSHPIAMEVDESNAQLIAAAPEMLEALELFYYDLISNGDGVASERLLKVEAIINKAKGLK